MKRTITLVDDDPTFRFLIRECLQPIATYLEIQEYGDGEALISSIISETFSSELVLLDLNMPCVGGFEVLKELRQHRKYLTLPVVVFTVSTSDSDKERAMELGANTFLSKPLDLNEIRRTVKVVYDYWLTLT